MASQIAQPIPLPDTLAAGDQWTLCVEMAEYLEADGWTATLFLRGPSVLDVTGTATDTGWDFVVEASASVDLEPGLYHTGIRVSKDAEIFTPLGTPIEVTPNLLAVVADELLSHEERCIPLLRAGILKRVQIDQTSYQITDRQATREQLLEMEALLRKYEDIVRQRGERLDGTFWRTHSVRF